MFYAGLDFHAGKDARLTPLRPGVFETALPGAPGTSVYRRLPSGEEVRRMAEAIDRLRRERRITSAVIVVQLPFWTMLAELLRTRFGWPIVYDCMDDHSGFSTNCAAMLRMEERLVAAADLAVVTSEALETKIGPKARRTALIRNACEYGHFASDSPLPEGEGTATSSPLPLGEGPGVRAERGSGFGTPGSGSSPHVLQNDYGPHPNPLPDGDGIDSFSPHPNPLPKGEGTATSSPLPLGEGTVLADAPPAAKQLTIGFYGAIAEWFDADLVADLAELRPRWRFELIGSTFTGDVLRLERLPNVTLLGEKPYADLPRLTAGWDAFIIPFKRIPLTEATNPVKAYEMLATGKPVVAVDLPELRPMARDGLLATADDARGFAEALERELAEDDDQRRTRRRAFAAANTWQVRGDALDRQIRALFPPASLIIVTYNNLHLNQNCLESVFRDTDWPNYEVIVVDNASSDGTAEWLAELAKEANNNGSTAQCLAAAGTAACGGSGADVPSAAKRRGTGATSEQRSAAVPADAERPGSVFPRGAWEQGGDLPVSGRGCGSFSTRKIAVSPRRTTRELRVARGKFLCLLNNDTVVTRGSISTLIGHLRAMPEVGIIGPVSNQVGNEAKVPVDYTTPAEMPRWAADYCRRHDGETFPIEMLGFFCVLFQRDLYEQVGELDERFGIGCFEDDDYCRRARSLGYELRCARDAFVHHWLEASFRLLGKQQYLHIFHENKQRYESKWGAGSMAGANDLAPLQGDNPIFAAAESIHRPTPLAPRRLGQSPVNGRLSTAQP